MNVGARGNRTDACVLAMPGTFANMPARRTSRVSHHANFRSAAIVAPAPAAPALAATTRFHAVHAKTPRAGPPLVRAPDTHRANTPGKKMVHRRKPWSLGERLRNLTPDFMDVRRRNCLIAR
ncbi:hypothetical protein, partial [Burkholderia pseudomallei]|uniref:hypothetical protein n=1 Tax=Burkholderia pseudomallei TaxID=28450 RepID=UPI001F343777